MKLNPDTLIKVTGSALAAAQAGLALGVELWGPTGAIPVHFNASGQADRWGDRGQPAGVVLTMALLSLVAVFALPALSRRRAAASMDASGVRAAQWILLTVTSLSCGLLAATTWGWSAAGHSLPAAAICIILAAVGAYLGKAAPNPLVGVRTPWSYASRLAWEKSNRLAGRLLFWGGLVGLIVTPFLPHPLGFRLLTAGVLVIAALSVFESWRVWRGDPDRNAGF